MLGVDGFVTESHNHTDNLDAVTAHSITQANPAVKPGFSTENIPLRQSG